MPSIRGCEHVCILTGLQCAYLLLWLLQSEGPLLELFNAGRPCRALMSVHLFMQAQLHEEARYMPGGRTPSRHM